MEIVTKTRKKPYIIEAKHLNYGTLYFSNLHKATQVLKISYVAGLKNIDTGKCVKGWYFHKRYDKERIPERFLDIPVFYEATYNQEINVYVNPKSDLSTISVMQMAMLTFMDIHGDRYSIKFHDRDGDNMIEFKSKDVLIYIKGLINFYVQKYNVKINNIKYSTQHNIYDASELETEFTYGTRDCNCGWNSYHVRDIYKGDKNIKNIINI